MTQKEYARLSGLIYLLTILLGIFSLVYVPSKIPTAWENASLTAQNILEYEFLYRLGILGGILLYILFSILPLALYRTLAPVNRGCALLMVIFSLTSIPFTLLNIVNKVDALTLLSGAEYLLTFEKEQIYTQVLLLLKSYSNGIQIIHALWGLWLLPFGYLVYKSNLLPKILGILLMAGCLSYLVRFCANLLFPEYQIPAFIRVPASLGEIGTCLWLLIMGIRTPPTITESNQKLSTSKIEGMS
ncbi:DUF4386 domain-containing protein [Microbulbifer sp. SSSA005]|uniref:DUF4386 domain-containing protein n=1 Tax=unclassified Microbulbifer TaxID=2619833 RepID=UPI00403AA7D2